MKSTYMKAYHLLDYLSLACAILKLAMLKVALLQTLQPLQLIYRLLLGVAVVNCIFVVILHFRLPKKDRLSFYKVAYKTYRHPYTVFGLTAFLLIFELTVENMGSTLWTVLLILITLPSAIIFTITSIKGFLSDE